MSRVINVKTLKTSKLFNLVIGKCVLQANLMARIMGGLKLNNCLFWA